MKTKVFTIPNILTMFRILLIPLLIHFCLMDISIYVLIIFILSMASDVLDGYIARKFNLTSDVGKVLDPLADKLTMIAFVLCLLIQGLFPLWILLFIVIKENLLGFATLFLLKKDIVVYSNFWGKASTCIFSMGIMFAIIFKDKPWGVNIFIVGIIFSIIAFINYARIAYIRLKEQS